MAITANDLLADTMGSVGAVLAVGLLITPLVRRARQPLVVAEIVAGIVLGPSLLGLFPWHLTTRLFPAAARPSLTAIAEVGILLFMFLVGWDMNLAGLRGQGGIVISVCLSSIALPFASGFALALWLYSEHQTVGQHHVAETAFALFVGTAMAITAFPVLARLIIEHRMQAEPAGVIALASAAIGDVAAWCMLAFVSIAAQAGSPSHMLWILLWLGVYISVLILVVRPFLSLLIRRQGRRTCHGIPGTALVAAGVFISAYVMNRIGLDPIFGAFSFGLIMPRASKAETFRAPTRGPLEGLAQFLLPVYFVSTGLSVDISRLTLSGMWDLLAVIAVACLGKFAGATGAARLAGMPGRDSVTVGILMNTRGLTELIVVSAGAAMGVLDSAMFTTMVLMALVTTAMTGFLLPKLRGPTTHPRPDTASSETESGVLHSGS